MSALGTALPVAPLPVSIVSPEAGTKLGLVPVGAVKNVGEPVVTTLFDQPDVGMFWTGCEPAGACPGPDDDVVRERHALDRRRRRS